MLLTGSQTCAKVDVASITLWNAGTRRCNRAGARWRRRCWLPAPAWLTCGIDAGAWRQTWRLADACTWGHTS